MSWVIKRSPCVCENDITVFNLVPRSLLNHLVGNDNSIPNIIVDLNEESVLCLFKGPMVHVQRCI